ncbi:MAG: helix-turn-helix domain-containing protein [Pseudomonadota bacterium]
METRDVSETIPSVFDSSCSARDALELIASKWTLLRRIEGISQKMLTQTLRALERNGLVIREDRQIVPRHVEYRLSPLGESLSEAIVILDRWAERYFPELDLAREHYDIRHGRERGRKSATSYSTLS